MMEKHHSTRMSPSLSVQFAGFLLAFFTFFLTPEGTASAAREVPYNVVVIIGDDSAAYTLGCYGNPLAQTPNLDRLADTGVRFDSAYCNSPVCTPSRQSLLTGMLPHTVGVTQLPTPLSDETITLAEVFKQAGYDTAAIGKMHFNSSLHHGFDTHIDPSDHRKYLESHPPRPLPDGIDVLPVWKPFADPARIWLNGSYIPYGAYDADMCGTWLAREAHDYISSHREKPFLLFASFTEPHSPFHFPLEYRGRFDPKQFTPPVVGPEDDWQIPEIFRELTKEEKQRIIASYYTSTAFLDKNIGTVLESVEKAGMSDHTLVIYLGDNGYNLGHHGRFEKHCFFEQAVRIPLLVRLPGAGMNGKPVTKQVELVDLFPTITEVCGVANPPKIQGESLVSLLKDGQRGGREFVFSEYLENEEAMIRTNQYKFIYTTGKRQREDDYKTGRPLPGRTRILYDIAADPEETTNLAGRPELAQVIAEIEAEMLQRFEETYPFTDGEIDSIKGVEDRLDWYLTPRDKKPSGN